MGSCASSKSSNVAERQLAAAEQKRQAERRAAEEKIQALTEQLELVQAQSQVTGVDSHAQGSDASISGHDGGVLEPLTDLSELVSGVDVGSVATGAGKFSGICAMDGKVYAAPWHSDEMLVYDVASKQVSGVDVTSVATGDYKFRGICAMDRKVYAAPLDSNKMLVYDVASKQVSGVDVTSVVTGDDKFHGICAMDGKVYAAPYKSNKMLVYDAASKQVSGVDVTSVVTGGGKFSGICAMDGKVYAAPLNSNKMLVYDVASKQVSGVDVTSGVTGDDKFHGGFSGICAMDGKVYAAPYNSNKMLVYDAASKQVSGVDVTSVATGGGKFHGIYAMDGKAYAAPLHSNKMLVYDVASKQVSGVDVTLVATGGGKFHGICAMDGKVYAAPLDSNKMLIYRYQDSEEDPEVLERSVQRQKEENARDLLRKNAAVDQKYAARLAVARARRKRESELLGVSLEYLLKTFPQEARASTGKEDPNFHEIAPVLLHGARGKGAATTCPRDGRSKSSFVDALPAQHRDKATHFLSWCWDYKLHILITSLEEWSRREQLSHHNTYIWICALCNNQYRILEEKSQTGADALEEMFGRRLRTAGKMLALFDDFSDPRYITRIWCIYELFTATKEGIPLQILLPPEKSRDFEDQLMDVGIRAVQQSLQAIDVAKAKATMPEDEEQVKRMIKATIGFDTINKVVKEEIRLWVKRECDKVLSRV